ncbi:mechanosensitive ion channel family protein [Croceimicrobium sp.]|uniref:mechanosensitive ion channel family protein n=1 Tax=Croceimicrobium sp. TaxID=2828340 RepID=UPI003BA8FEE0
MDSLKDFFELELLKVNDWTLTVANLLWVVLVILVAILMRWLFKKYLRRLEKLDRLDRGKSYAIYSIGTYIIFIIAIISSIDSLGFNVTVLLASSSGVLIGLGLGLQDLFRDMIAGFIILFERTVTAGDIVEVNGTIGQVKDVGLRTTTLLTREQIILIVPNVKLTTDNVINWSQNNHVTRFSIPVGVAYGSDTKLVEKLLMEVAENHPDVLKAPKPMVFFKDFGESSLDFHLYFFSRNLFQIEKTKSEMRYEIDQKFRDNKVSIPFPQRDLWFRNAPNTEPEE